jgi:hypothetical protein
MLPWIKRWEEAISRDLLPEEDQEEYFPEFDVRGLLRGDSAMRSAYYRDLFNIGVLSQNDIRRLENENPIEGGNRYFVPLNMVPTDRLDEALDEPEPAPAAAPPRDDARRAFGVLVEDCAERIARAEIRELEKRADRAVEDRPRFDAWVEGFYADHSGYVLKTLAPLAGAWALQSQRAVDTAGLVVSSLGISNEDFLKGRLRFGETPGARAVTSIRSVPLVKSVITSLPSIALKMKISAPRPPVRTSLPTPPRIWSPLSPPTMESAPARPMMMLRPASPVSTSLKSVPCRSSKLTKV